MCEGRKEGRKEGRMQIKLSKRGQAIPPGLKKTLSIVAQSNYYYITFTFTLDINSYTKTFTVSKLCSFPINLHHDAPPVCRISDLFPAQNLNLHDFHHGNSTTLNPPSCA
jgi:hypothetical protein